MEKIKVVHIVHSFLKGGIESFLYYLTDEQKKNPNLELTILCCEDRDKILNDRILNNGIKCHFIRIKALTVNPIALFKAYRVCRSADILHFQIFLPVLSFVLGFAKGKKIYTIHNSGAILRENDFKKNLKRKLFKFYLDRFVDIIVSNSFYTQSFWFGEKINSTSNIVIYNGVPPITSSPSSERVLKEFPELSKLFIIGTTSRFISWKRVNLLINAFSKVKRENAKLLLVGDGPERAALEGMVDTLGIANRVIFTGFKSNVIDYQYCMDVCVFPSVSEPFGLVGVECLRLGKPVIVMRDGGGLPEIIGRIEKDNIVDSVETLARRLEYYYDNYELLADRDLIRRDEAEAYSSKIAANKYYLAYRSVFKNN